MDSGKEGGLELRLGAETASESGVPQHFRTVRALTRVLLLSGAQVVNQRFKSLVNASRKVKASRMFSCSGLMQ